MSATIIRTLFYGTVASAMIIGFIIYSMLGD